MSQVFYMNIRIESAKGMLEAKIGSKGVLPGKPLSKIAVKAGEKMLTPERLAPKLGPKMAEQMPTKLKENGISATAKCELVVGAIIVIKVTIKEVDVSSILEKLGEKKPDAAKVGTCIMNCLPPEVVAKVQEEVLAKKVAEKLADKMGPGMEAQVKEQGIKLSAAGVVPALQGEYLISILQKHKPAPAEVVVES